MLAAEAAAKKAAEEKKRQEEQQKQQESQKNNASSGSNVDTNDVYEGGVFTWPCPSSRKITSGFGYRDKPTAGATSYHQGYDIGASAGAAIVAAADGVVTSTGYSSVLGNYVILSHGGGLFTIYEHCSAVLGIPGTECESWFDDCKGWKYRCFYRTASAFWRSIKWEVCGSG